MTDTAKRYVHIDFFDTNASSYRHKLDLQVKPSGTAFSVIVETNTLAVNAADGTIRNIPLANVKEYYVFMKESYAEVG